MTLLIKKLIIVCLGPLLYFLLLISPFDAEATQIMMKDFGDNDCAGFFNPSGAKGFEACTIFVTQEKQNILISPVIAKYDTVKSILPTTATAMNDTKFPSIDGTEFTFSSVSPESKSGTWTYTPGVNDPGVRYWAAKAGKSFTLFWEVPDTTLCDSSNPFTLGCLNEALAVKTGQWGTPDNKGLSHITFYDSVPPQPVPEPGTFLLVGTGLVSLLGLYRWRMKQGA
jgi:hypothetical protein